MKVLIQVSYICKYLCDLYEYRKRRNKKKQKETKGHKKKKRKKHKEAREIGKPRERSLQIVIVLLLSRRIRPWFRITQTKRQGRP